MSESILRAVLEESAQHEWDKYDSAPEHTFSRKHCRSMKRIFRLQYDNKHHFYGISNSSKRIRITRKTVLILVIIVFLSAVAGCTAAYFISKSFRGKVHSDNTELFAINTYNCPSFIEDKYYLSDLLQDFEVFDTDSTPFYEYTNYKNMLMGQNIAFRQWVKTEYDSSHYNTESQNFEEIEINGYYGICLDFSPKGNISSCLIWDNGDYILELSGDLPKNELIVLAKTAKKN